MTDRYVPLNPWSQSAYANESSIALGHKCLMVVARLRDIRHYSCSKSFQQQKNSLLTLILTKAGGLHVTQRALRWGRDHVTTSLLNMTFGRKALLPLKNEIKKAYHIWKSCCIAIKPWQAYMDIPLRFYCSTTFGKLQVVTNYFFSQTREPLKKYPGRVLVSEETSKSINFFFLLKFDFFCCLVIS